MENNKKKKNSSTDGNFPKEVLPINMAEIEALAAEIENMSSKKKKNMFSPENRPHLELWLTLIRIALHCGKPLDEKSECQKQNFDN